MKTLLIAGDRIVDGKGTFSETQKIMTKAQKKGLSMTTLEIVTLAKRWEDKLNPLEFKSGASAMAALEKAKKLLKEKKTDLVIIKGSDYLKTGYEKGARENFLKLYQKKYSPLDGYDRLVPLFLKLHHVTEKDYVEIRNALFENYIRTWKKIDAQNMLPDERWFKPLSKYFRGVDCANPNIDYSGQIILTTQKIADTLRIPKKSQITILGNAFTKLSVDGFESLPKIAPYQHLKRTLNKALNEAKVDFKTEFLQGRALLDAYTCYPVVPMALILKLGLVKKMHEIPEFLQNYEITVTGGLNLGKAPWSLTALNSIIVMRERLLSSKKSHLGLVHGNGSLGNQQGITILQVR
ncbi:MAG: hypothetical protein ACOYL6_14735 [Bacteriovoracaceae bacterium]